jgi:hypothetical protein
MEEDSCNDNSTSVSIKKLSSNPEEEYPMTGIIPMGISSLLLKYIVDAFLQAWIGLFLITATMTYLMEYGLGHMTNSYLLTS